VLYFPGCTLKTTAINFETSAKAVAKRMGIELEEMPKWNCCGTVFSLASDDLMHHIAPIRILIRAQELGHKRLVTLCAMCYNTLKMANEEIRQDKEKMEKINAFMDDEPDYEGSVEVLHFLELLRDIPQVDIKNKVERSLEGLKVMPYYGCLLVRPEYAALDDNEYPKLMEDMLRSIGAEPVYVPYNVECCGAYQTVNRKEMVAQRTYKIISAAKKRGAEAIVLSCPLCDFNLDNRQKEAAALFKDLEEMPVFYFTQLMALAFGCRREEIGLDGHYIDPKPLLRKKGLLEEVRG